MEENYMEKYKSIIYDIEHIENIDNEDKPWYSEEYFCPAYDKLKEKFPNVTFSKEDLLKLRNYSKIKENNDQNIYDLEDSKYGYSFYQLHGHMKTKEENAQYNESKKNKADIDEEYNKAFTTFFHLCESLNAPKENNSINMEKDIFEPLYEYDFNLRPQDTITKNYYETYKKYRQEKEEKENLSQSNQDLYRQIDDVKNENVKIKQENTVLKDRNTVLQKMLSKTIEFCNHVKNSRFGKFFFKKQIKSLPEANIKIDDFTR